MSAGCRASLVVWAAISMSFVATPSGQSARVAGAAPPQTLGVPGASNTTPSLFALGRTALVVWTAAREGKSNIYLAVSRDGGVKFSAPVRVNDREGDAGATPEQPPRVVISGTGSDATITVMWSKRDTGPMDTRRDTIQTARSTDGGRTFSPARFTHDTSLSGARGWQALTPGANGAVHAVWLDGREANQKIAAMSHSGTPHKGQPPQEVYHGTLTADGRMMETRIAEDVCFCCKTAVAVDARGAVYAAW